MKPCEGSLPEFPRLCSALAGLERLMVASHDSAAVGLVPHLSLLSRLTGLCIEGNRYWWGTPVSASFLTPLTRLVDLKLHYVLSADNASFDIRFLIRLTRLQWLVVKSAFALARPPVQQLQAEPPDQQQHVLVKCEDLRSLNASRMLEAWDLSRAGHWEGSNPNCVVAELRGFRGCSTGQGLSRWKWPSVTAP